MPSVDPRLLKSISSSGGVFKGYRHQAPRRDPISGKGAEHYGGRFNPPHSFPVVYLCTTRLCAVAEFKRLVEREPATHGMKEALEGFLPRLLWEINVTTRSLLDLTDSTVRSHLSVSLDDLVNDDYLTTQAIGVAANSAGIQAILSHSATGQDDVLVILRNNIHTMNLSAKLLTAWTTVQDIP